MVLNHNIPFEKYFEEISMIPRGSGNEAAIANYLMEFAQNQGLQAWRDKLDNVIIKKAGSNGRENLPPVILQAHTDMVCVKAPGCKHDFEKDPIELVVENNILRANKTTLGADDGAGVATILGLLAEREMTHPPIEAVFTTQEEIGMFGAQALDYSLLHGRRMISMDSGGESESSVNAAGCETIEFSKRVKTEKVFGYVVTMRIEGLLGGHSGSCIDMERGNAIKICAMLMRKLQRNGIRFRIANISAGQASNAIPDSCKIEFLVNDDECVMFVLAEYITKLNNSFRETEAGLEIVLSSTGNTVRIMSEEDSLNLIDFLTLLPNGRLHKSMIIDNFVIASCNVAMLDVNDGQITVKVSARAANEFKLDEVEDRIMLAGVKFGMNGIIEERTPCWEYMPHSPMRSLAAELMMKEWGIPLKQSFEHGGLECGYFAQNIPDVDIYVIGPIGRNVHTVQECLDLKSAHRVYEFLKKYLALLTD